MRILVLNWRDIKNPIKGGAEVATHELAKRWTYYGNRVTQFSSYFPGARKNEIIDKIKIIREGNPDMRSLHNSVQFKAMLYYQKNKEKFDLVIDQMHGIPFFSPLYIRKKKVLFICEVAKDIWYESFGYALGLAGRLIEKVLLSSIYRNMPVLTISESTKKDLISVGTPVGNIKVIKLGFTRQPILEKKIKKEKELALIYLGRLTKSKGIEDAIYAFSKIKKIIPETTLWVVGNGTIEYEKYIKMLSEEVGIRDVLFYGFIPEKEKFLLLCRAHMLIFPSIREGWGLTAIEANSVKTPVVAYNSPGLRDSIVHGKTGLLCKENNPSELANNVIDLFRNKKLYKKLQIGGYEWSKQFSWKQAGRESLNYFLY